MTRTDRTPARLRRLVAAPAVVVLLALGTGCAAPGGQVSDERLAEVADRGRSVMPFDLERTTHRFAEADTGGVQTVVSDDPADTAQIDLVREHLREEAGRFAAGDFTDPGRIHGHDMPGLAALREGAGRIGVEYADTADGGRITYTTSEPALVAALHAWFDAQVGDHGSHATHG
jgi:hypothetical protein